MHPCHSCHIYGIWRSKEVGDSLKSSFAVAMQATRKENFYWKGGGGGAGGGGISLGNTAVLKLYCRAYWGL